MCGRRTHEAWVCAKIGRQLLDSVGRIGILTQVVEQVEINTGLRSSEWKVLLQISSQILGHVTSHFVNLRRGKVFVPIEHSQRLLIPNGFVYIQRHTVSCCDSTFHANCNAASYKAFLSFASVISVLDRSSRLATALEDIVLKAIVDDDAEFKKR